MSRKEGCHEGCWKETKEVERRITGELLSSVCQSFHFRGYPVLKFEHMAASIPVLRIERRSV
jgi:hypothetical protein